MRLPSKKVHILKSSQFHACKDYDFVSEMARRKMEYHIWEHERHKHGTNSTSRDLSNYERFQMNRKRRLMKEQAQLSTQTSNKDDSKKEDASADVGDDKCRKCFQEILPPYHLYLCHKNHLHKERRLPTQSSEIQVKYFSTFKSENFVYFLVLLRMLWTLFM